VESSIKIRPFTDESGVVLRLSGVLDETFDHSQLTSFSGSVLVLDMAEVTRITSFGVREWINALRNIKANFYCFINCRPSILAQFNMVASFGGEGVLVSFYAPYVCPECDHEEDRLIDLRRDYAVAVADEPGPIKCSSCGAESEFDEIPEAYFSYVASRPAPSVPPMVERLIDGELTDVKNVLRIKKEVDGEITALYLSGPINKKARLKRALDGIEGHVVILGSGITEAQPEGLDHFTNLVQVAKSIAVADVPLNIAIDIKKHPNFANTTILSARAVLQCARCGTRQNTTIDRQRLRAYRSGEISLFDCDKCQGKPELDEASNAAVAAAEGLISDASDEQVNAYYRLLQNRSTSGVITLGGEEQSARRAYHLERRIGVGGMAEIYLARHKGTQGFQKQVVLKRILPSYASNAVFVEMFLQEARLAAQILHPNVVQIFDLGHLDDQFCIVMEYVKGRNLRELINSTQRKGALMPAPIACRIVSDVCAGLHAAHVCVDHDGKPLGVVHRDISPANVLISDEGAVKLTDFGVAKAYESVSLTQPGELKGKLMYLAPEQVLFPNSPATVQTDIFAVGILFYECLTNLHPFRRSTKYASLSAMVSSEAPDVNTIRGDLPPEIARVLEKALSKNPEVRHRSADELRNELDLAVASLSMVTATSQIYAWMQSLDQMEDAPENPDEEEVTPAKAPLHAGNTTVTAFDASSAVKSIEELDGVDAARARIQSRGQELSSQLGEKLTTAGKKHPAD